MTETTDDASNKTPDVGEHRSGSGDGTPGNGAGRDIFRFRVLLINVIVWGALLYLISRNMEWGQANPDVPRAVGIVVVLAAATLTVSMWKAHASVQKRQVLSLAAAVAVVGLVVLLKAPLQATIFGVLFCVVLAVMPASLYSFFRAARGQSLADEFVSNLKRLGVANCGDQNRLVAYVREFAALYGPLEPKQRKMIAAELHIDPDLLPSDSLGLLERLGTHPARSPQAAVRYAQYQPLEDGTHDIARLPNRATSSQFGSAPRGDQQSTSTNDTTTGRLPLMRPARFQIPEVDTLQTEFQSEPPCWCSRISATSSLRSIA